MSRYFDIDPGDINPDTGRPYEGYSSPALDDSAHRNEMDCDDEPGAGEFITRRPGYLPCRIISRGISKRGEVLVEFKDGARKWMSAAHIKGAEGLGK
jgi:hypothetical protein